MQGEFKATIMCDVFAVQILSLVSWEDIVRTHFDKYLETVSRGSDASRLLCMYIWMGRRNCYHGKSRMFGQDMLELSVISSNTSGSLALSFSFSLSVLSQSYRLASEQETLMQLIKSIALHWYPRCLCKEEGFVFLTETILHGRRVCTLLYVEPGYYQLKET